MSPSVCMISPAVSAERMAYGFMQFVILSVSSPHGDSESVCLRRVST